MTTQSISPIYQSAEMLDYFKCDEDFNNYLYVITGFNYHFAVVSSRPKDDYEEYGVFYQLRPRGNDDGFFDWYCYRMADKQHFRTKTEAVLRFTMQWVHWNSTRGINFLKGE